MADWPKDVKTIAVITWDDSHSISGWQGPTAWKGDFEDFDTTCVSVGYIAHEDDKRVWLMQSLSACGSMAEGMCIPKHAVLARYEFEPGPGVTDATNGGG